MAPPYRPITETPRVDQVTATLSSVVRCPPSEVLPTSKHGCCCPIIVRDRPHLGSRTIAFPHRCSESSSGMARARLFPPTRILTKSILKDSFPSIHPCHSCLHASRGHAEMAVQSSRITSMGSGRNQRDSRDTQRALSTGSQSPLYPDCPPMCSARWKGTWAGWSGVDRVVVIYCKP